MNKKIIELRRKQRESIYTCITEWGVPVGKHKWGQSINNLCEDVNNRWDAPLFTNKLCDKNNNYISCKKEGCKHSFEYDCIAVDELRNRVLRAVKKNPCFELKKIDGWFYIYCSKKQVKK